MAENLSTGISARTMRSVWAERKRSFSRRAGIIAMIFAAVLWAFSGFDSGWTPLIIVALCLAVFVAVILQWLLDSTNYADCTKCNAVRTPHEIMQDLANPRERQCATCGAPEQGATCGAPE